MTARDPARPDGPQAAHCPDRARDRARHGDDLRARSSSATRSRTRSTTIFNDGEPGDRRRRSPSRPRSPATTATRPGRCPSRVVDQVEGGAGRQGGRGADPGAGSDRRSTASASGSHRRRTQPRAVLAQPSRSTRPRSSQGTPRRRTGEVVVEQATRRRRRTSRSASTVGAGHAVGVKPVTLVGDLQVRRRVVARRGDDRRHDLRTTRSVVRPRRRGFDESTSLAEPGVSPVELERPASSGRAGTT